MKPKLKPPGTKRLKLKCDILLSTDAFKFNLRRYILVESLQVAVATHVSFDHAGSPAVGLPLAHFSS